MNLQFQGGIRFLLKHLAAWSIPLWLLTIFAIPAAAHQVCYAAGTITCSGANLQFTACNLNTCSGQQYRIDYTITFSPACNGVSSVSGSTGPFTATSATMNLSASTTYALTCSSTSACLSATMTGLGPCDTSTSGPFTNFNGLCNVSLNCGHAPSICSSTGTVTCSNANLQFNACNLTKGNNYTIGYTINFSPSCNGVSSVSGSTAFTATGTSMSASASTTYGPLTCSSTSACVQATISGPEGSSGPITFSNLCNLALNCTPVPETCNCTRPSGGSNGYTGGGATSTFIINELGAAGPGNFTVLGLGGSGASITINLATVTGNVGAPNSTNITESSPSAVTGEIILGSAVSAKSLGGKNGSVETNEALLETAVSDAMSAASYFAGLPATLPASAFNNGNINGNVTVQGVNGAVNVVDLPQLSVTSGTLTLVGTAGTTFIINIAGNFNLHSGNIAVSGGMGPLDVLYNITSSSATVTTMVPTTGVGILLAPNNTINSMDSSTFTGEVIGGYGKNITLMSGTKMQNSCYCGTSP